MSCGQRQLVMHISQYLLYWVFYTWLRLTSNNSISFDDILFKAPIPRQGNHLIRDFTIYYTCTINKSNTTTVQEVEDYIKQ